MNSVNLVGRFTFDPELRKTESNIPYVTFSLAVQRPFKNKDNEYDVDFIPCKAWNGTAEFVDKYFKKGDAIGVKGRIELSKDTKHKEPKYYTTVVCDSVEFVGSKKQEERTTNRSNRR